MNIVDIIKTETKEGLDKTAIIESGVHISYGRLLELVDGLSVELKGYDLKSGQRIGLIYEDSIDYIIICLSVLSLSAVIVPIPFSSSPSEIETVIKEIKLNFLIFENVVFKSADAKRISCVGIQKELYLYNCLNKEEPPPEFYHLNPAFIRFSSGTTAKSKGVVLSHETILERTNAADKGLKITPNDKIAWVLSMSFHFVVTILLFLRRSATIVLVGKDFPEAMLKILKQNKVTFLYASPFHYHMLNCDAEVLADSLSGLRVAVSTATRLSSNIADGFYEKFGFELCQAYGIIEVGLPFINDSRDKTKRNSVGKILADYRMKLVEPDKEGVGRIYLQGKGMLDAYFYPWQNRQQILENGWFNTGDVGKQDEDGFLYIVGRNTNVINFCGMKIFPEEVESVLNRYPFIQESMVYGTNHPQYGQIPMAKVVLKKEARDNFDLKSLHQFCYQHLISYKVPKEVQLVAELEKTRSGKLTRGNVF